MSAGINLVMTEHNLAHADAFISYSPRDSAWVRELLVPTLKNAGVTVWFDAQDFEPGAPRLTEIERAVLNSRKTLIVLSPAYLAGEWGEFENILSQSLDPAARQRRVLPLLLQPCDMPPRMGMLTFLDFTEHARYESQFQRLLKALDANATVVNLPTGRADPREKEIRTLKGRRLHELLKQQAIKGINTPPEVLMEIEDLKRELAS